jgi:hypothetical protein
LKFQGSDVPRLKFRGFTVSECRGFQVTMVSEFQGYIFLTHQNFEVSRFQFEGCLRVSRKRVPRLVVFRVFRNQSVVVSRSQSFEVL